MKTFARIEAGKVAETFRHPTNPHALFDPSWVWLECPGDTRQQCSWSEGAGFFDNPPAPDYVAPLPPLEARKAAMQAAIRAKRWDIETGGVDVAGTRVRSDETSQNKIDGAIALFDKDPTLASIDFEAQHEVWVTLDQATIEMVGIAVGRHVQACFSRARVLSEAVTAAADNAALDLIDVTAGWPA